jgi:peptidoglycan/xylan/chitin deacetylase (PgdA/CDA1 family)
VGWLAERGVPATVFVVTAHVGADNTWEGRTERGIPTLPLMGWAELERLVGLGVTIGAHTRTHRRLTDLASAAIEDEMEQCVEDLRARLGVGAAHLAYPYGAVDDRVAALASARFTSALTTRFGPLSPADVPPRLPRLDMYYFRRPGAIGSWGTREFHRRLGWVRLRRRMREVVT